jgi:mercuric reductase
MELTGLPESMVLIGGNAVGLELGQLFARLGTRVTIVEIAGSALAFDEPEISAAIQNILEDEGIGIATGADITSAGRGTAGRSVHVKTAGVNQTPQPKADYSGNAANHWSKASGMGVIVQ